MFSIFDYILKFSVYFMIHFNRIITIYLNCSSAVRNSFLQLPVRFLKFIELRPEFALSHFHVKRISTNVFLLLSCLFISKMEYIQFLYIYSTQSIFSPLFVSIKFICSFNRSTLAMVLKRVSILVNDTSVDDWISEDRANCQNISCWRSNGLPKIFFIKDLMGNQTQKIEDEYWKCHS